MVEMKNRVREIMVSVLGIEATALKDIVREERMEWDSLNHMQLIFMIEDEYKIRFTIEEITQIQTEEQLVLLVSEKTGT
ncbi:acyl carrier protein [Paenibacillus camerounensis]|uniref:acyl carrier protein n=1 Tax=Paenibacillus camerounensis TaxID=1243663 RepID=UPI0006945D6E|nr:acyl carrier protein [Paenibacillus camerounensis]